MANINKDKRDQLYPIIVIKQFGEYCVRCKRDPFILDQLGRSSLLVIDHINNDNTDNRLENLQFLCVSCNTKKNNPVHEPTKRDMPGEYDISKANEGKFRAYVFGRVLLETAIERKGLIADGAEFVGCSPQAIKNYLFKMTSPSHGIYKYDKRNNGFWYLELKPEYR